MGLYEELKATNYAEVMLNDIAKLRFIVAEDEVIKSRTEFAVPKLDSPWIWSGKDPTRICAVWENIYFSKYRFISRNCFNCWKIVLRLDKITSLLKLLQLQTKMNEENPERYNSKCGIETRAYAKYKGRYAGFWYCSMVGDDGLGEAKLLTREVETRVQKGLATGLKVSLKRGCTEMEERFGPSNLWTYDENHHEVEDDLDKLIEIRPRAKSFQPEWLKRIIMANWIEHAFETGDKTVKELVEHFPESFGISPTAEYYREEPKMVCPKIRKGKTNADYATIQRI